MRPYERHKLTAYLLCDWFSAILSWATFFVLRKSGEGIDFVQAVEQSVSDGHFWMGVTLIPLCWLFLYTLMGSYRRVLRKSRLRELGQTLLASVIGCIIIFFACSSLYVTIHIGFSV